MNRLTAGQVANEIGVSIYTLKRWYRWFEQEDVNKLNELVKKGMPELPRYETMGKMNWKLWTESDVEQLKKFKAYIPNTRGGFMGSLYKKGNENGK